MKLYPFQQYCVDYLGIKPSVLVAYEMGTGKSYIGVARDELIRETFDKNNNFQTLVIAPLSVVEMWYNLFKSEDYSVRRIDNKNRDLLLQKPAEVYIVHWDALRLMPELAKINWDHIIADECHRAQNRKAQQTIALKKIKGNFKTGLSGTPVTNTPDRLWSILNWLYPKEFKSYWSHFNRYVEWEWDETHQYKIIKGPKDSDILHDKIGAFYSRKTKKEVLPDLPDKYYTEISVDLTEKQFKAYEDMRKHMIAWLGENEDIPLVSPIVVSQLMRLQQFSDAYAVIGPDNKVRLSEPSSKLDALMDVIETGQQLVVFSQFSQMVDLLQARLKKKKIEFSRLTGKVPQFLRQRAVDDFQAGRTQVFMGTIAAGGVGVTLTRASTVAFLDRSWSPADNSQAEDRLHRMGQENAVQVVDLIARGTVDLGRRTKLEVKKEWLRQLLDP